MMQFTVRVEFAIARPPTPANTRTSFVTVQIEDRDQSHFDADSEAREIAMLMLMARRGVVMPLSARVESAIL